MTVIHFENRTDPATTPIHNEFIDKYLPKADGNFVKVYIFIPLLLSSKTISQYQRYFRKIGLVRIRRH